MFNKEEMYSRPIYSGSGITIAAAITMIMALVLRHCLTKMTLGDLLTLLHIFFPPSNFLSTRYKLHKLFAMCHNEVEKHFYCVKRQVHSHLGTVVLGTVVMQQLCPIWGADLTIESNTGMFLVLPLECQLREMFEHSNVKDAVHHPYSKTKRGSCNIEDMYDGSAHQSMRNSDTDCISMTWNCDGVKAFTSSMRSIWLKLKHHFIEHYPELIRESGLLIHMWTMRFEAKRAYFKTVVSESRCFKNVLKMLYHSSTTTLSSCCRREMLTITEVAS